MSDTTSDGAIAPRSVLIADQELYLRIAQDQDHVQLLEDTNAMIVPYEGQPEVNEVAVSAVRRSIATAGRLIPGALLVRNPYGVDGYEPAEDAIEAFSIAKYHALANVGRLLGATEIHFVEAKVKSERADFQAKIAALLPVGAADAEAARELTKKIEDRLDGHLHFSGGEPDPEAAHEYLRCSNLATDPQLRALVEMRSGTNLMTKYAFTISGTREAATNFNSALQIASAGPVKAVDIGARFAMMAHTIRNVEIRTEIRF